jgi:GNAT superfamily N-acetyltransferase
MSGRVRVTVSSEERSLGVVDAVVDRFAANAGIDGDEAGGLRALVHDAVEFSLTHAYPDDPTGEIEVTLDVAERAVRVDVHDWGRPLAAGGGGLGKLPPGLAQLDERSDDLRLINLGADGKRISFTRRVAHTLDAGPGAHDFEAPRQASSQPDADVLARVEVRGALPADAEQISGLLYENYHLSYGHPDFYRPRWVADALEEGSLLSTVAAHEGEIVGHHAVMLEDGSASAETGVAVVHPAFRGLGVFGRLFDHTLARVGERCLEAVFGRAVTVHPYSQRAERAHGYRESALMLGSVPARMTMEGIDSTGPGARTASLLGYRLLRPSSREARLPAVYERQLQAAYAHVGLTEGGSTKPASPSPDQDPITVTEDETRGTGTIAVTGLGEAAEEELAHAVRHLLARHLDVIYADLDLQSLERIDAAVAGLNGIGFFYSGLAPCGLGGHDFLRLQRLNCEHVELERIVCDSPFAKAVLRDVLEDKQRVDG